MASSASRSLFSECHVVPSDSFSCSPQAP
jgi:hypothetical protein